MAENPLPALSRLIKRLGAEAHEDYLDLQMAVVLPNSEEDGPHHLQTIFAICEREPDDKDTSSDDEAFEAMVAEQDKAEEKRKAETTTEALLDLRRRLEGGGDQGIL